MDAQSLKEVKKISSRGECSSFSENSARILKPIYTPLNMFKLTLRVFFNIKLLLLKVLRDLNTITIWYPSSLKRYKLFDIWKVYDSLFSELVFQSHFLLRSVS